MDDRPSAPCRWWALNDCKAMIHLGLCCTFKEEPIRFRTTTVAYLSRCPDPLAHINKIVADNIDTLSQALDFCEREGVGAFRVNSQFFPCCTHPKVAYTIDDLPDGDLFKERLKGFQERGVRLSFHPDQFIVLSSPKEEVVANSIRELEYQGELASLIGADIVNIHAGGAYDSKVKALQRFERSFAKLSTRVQSRLTVENDDRTYTPEDLLPMCNNLKIPLVYDVHHHRCNQDTLSIEAATDLAIETWNRSPLFHISSPIEGWSGKNVSRHSDYIDIHDFPKFWFSKELSLQKLKPSLELYVDVEAKAKELAVLKFQKELQEIKS